MRAGVVQAYRTVGLSADPYEVLQRLLPVPRGSSTACQKRSRNTPLPPSVIALTFRVVTP